MSIAVLQVDAPGLALTIQDSGRAGWRRWGVPPSGCMDDHAALWANRLLDNSTNAALLELQFQGAMLTVLETIWIAITGADLGCNVPTWRALRLEEGDQIQFRLNRCGLWSYLAVEGGLQVESILGSRSTYPRGQIGHSLCAGDVLCRNPHQSFTLPPGVAGRTVPWTERRDYSKPPVLRVWSVPQGELFEPSEHDQLFGNEWTVTSQSDRVGYRLLGASLRAKQPETISEPVRIGSIQVPKNGQPLVTMRDGPTVGGYPQIGMVDKRDLSWLAQCRPGQKIRFQKAE